MPPSPTGSIHRQSTHQVWTRIFHVCPHSIGETRFLFEKKENEKKLVFSSFEKPAPRWGTVLFGVATYFLFLFLKWRKLSKNKNP